MHQLYCSARCRQREKMRRYRQRRETSIPDDAAQTMGVERTGAQLEIRQGANLHLRAALARAVKALSGHHRTRLGESDGQGRLAQAQELLAAQRCELEAARSGFAQLHADATDLANTVARSYQAQGWAGYDGLIKDVVERYVRTGQ